MISKNQLVLVFLFFSAYVFANNLLVEDVSLVDQNIVGGYTYVQFDVSWENSWRTNSADPFNYDAVWVFVKYKDSNGLWKHASLSTIAIDHSVTNNNGVAVEFKVGLTGGIGKGVFIQRSGNGTGSINWDGVKLRWNYGTDGVADGENVTVKVFSIEMVYIPQASFYVGDGTTSVIKGQLHDATSTTTPFNITSENSITLGRTIAGNLGNNNATGQNDVDDFNNTTTQTLPAAFPKGYNAFYIMKYEISQGQYVQFLNCLSRVEQNTRTHTDISGTSVTNRYVMSGTTTMSYRNSIRCDVTLPLGSTPVTFYNDYNGNGTSNESDDGQNIACNFLTYMDGAAYTDWAALRPFTELEYEKSCRGTLTPVANEFSWGDIVAQNSSQYEPLSNPGENNELPATASTDFRGNFVYSFSTGPYRCGIFAISNSNRTNSGAGYYGVMNMSGNVFERCVSIGNSTGRSFIGTHGDGVLTSVGNGDNGDWPGYEGSAITNAIGEGPRGSGYIFREETGRISARQYASSGFATRQHQWGFRCSRTEPQ